MQQVLDACLDSIQANSDVPYDLLVFDNGSCLEIKSHLLDRLQEGRIQYLWLSEKNLARKGPGTRSSAVPQAISSPIRTTIVTTTRAGFPSPWSCWKDSRGAGMVTSRPFRLLPTFKQRRLPGLRNQGSHTGSREIIIPFEVFREFDLSLGQSEQRSAEHYDASEDVRIAYKGLQAIVGGIALAVRGL